MVSIKTGSIPKSTTMSTAMSIPDNGGLAYFAPSRAVRISSPSPTGMFGAYPLFHNSTHPFSLGYASGIIPNPLPFDGIAGVAWEYTKVIHHFHECSHVYAKHEAYNPIGLLLNHVGVVYPFGKGTIEPGFQFVSQRFASECFMARLLATSIDLVIPASFDSPGTAADRTEDGDLAVMRQGEILPTKGWPTRRWGAGLRRKGFSGWFMRPSLSRL